MKSRLRVLTLFVAALAVSVAAQARSDGATPDPAAGTPAPAPAHHSKHAAASGTKSMTREDLNAATREQLMTLPGVTGEIADKIIAARPFTNRSDLLTKKLVTRKEYGQLRSHVTVKSAEGEKK